MALRLTIKASSSVPLEVEGVLPESVRDKSLDEIASLQIYQGNRPVPLGDFFAVEGDTADDRIEWVGDLSGVHWVGAKMNGGEILVEGPVGRHLGSEMKAGRIEVRGAAGDWVGGELKGGLIRVRGRAGHLVGAAYRGSPRGMTGGTILIEGDVGNELGHTMRRGLLAVGGSIGDLAGFNMLAGTILVGGESGIRHGAGMRRGTLIFAGSQAPDLLPSFRAACRTRPPIFELLARELRRLEFPLADALVDSPYEMFHGDLIEGGRGEVFLRVAEPRPAAVP